MEEGNHMQGSSGFAYRKQYFHLVLSKAYNFIALTAAGEHPFNCPSIQVKTGLFRVFKKKNEPYIKNKPNVRPDTIKLLLENIGTLT